MENRNFALCLYLFKISLLPFKRFESSELTIRVFFSSRLHCFHAFVLCVKWWRTGYIGPWNFMVLFLVFNSQICVETVWRNLVCSSKVWLVCCCFLIRDRFNFEDFFFPRQAGYSLCFASLAVLSLFSPDGLTLYWCRRGFHFFSIKNYYLFSYHNKIMLKNQSIRNYIINFNI